MTYRPFTLVAFLALPIAAFAQAPQSPAMPGMTMAPPPAASSSPADKAFGDAMDAMMKAMQTQPTGDADRDFATMMIPHHQGAIDMARIELQYGKDPTMRKLARDIVAAQEREIALMKRFLATHRK